MPLMLKCPIFHIQSLEISTESLTIAVGSYESIHRAYLQMSIVDIGKAAYPKTVYSHISS